MENIVVPTPGCWNINDIYSPNELVKEGKLVKKENGQYVAPQPLQVPQRLSLPRTSFLCVFFREMPPHLGRHFSSF